MTDYLFDTPYWLLGLLLLVGISLLVSGNNRQERRLIQAGIAPIALAILLAILSFLVQTDKERVIQSTRQLVGAVEQKDSKTVAQLLHPYASLLWMTKQDLVDAAARASGDYRIKSLGVSSIEASESRESITVSFSVSATIESSVWSGSTPSSWQIVWIKTPQGYLARDINVLQLPPGLDLQSLIARWKK